MSSAGTGHLWLGTTTTAFALATAAATIETKARRGASSGQTAATTPTGSWRRITVPSSWVSYMKRHSLEKQQLKNCQGYLKELKEELIKKKKACLTCTHPPYLSA